MESGENQIIFPARNYDLSATLDSGQAFRWQREGDAWTGVIGGNWVCLRSGGDAIVAQTARPVAHWDWLAHYLQIQTDLDSVLATFPDDEPMRSAVNACGGLRLLRQDPWECLASFILSSTKQIVQIQQIIGLLCERYGTSIAAPPKNATAFAFPTSAQLAAATEAGLRGCKMGFRAPYLLATARMIERGEIDLARLPDLPLAAARTELLKFPGVGRKIADCVLLFACGFQDAFPVDTWVMKALRQLYFSRRKPRPQRVLKFTETYFGRHAGYAQQYLFHYMRTREREPVRASLRK